MNHSQLKTIVPESTEIRAGKERSGVYLIRLGDQLLTVPRDPSGKEHRVRELTDELRDALTYDGSCFLCGEELARHLDRV